MSFKRHDQRRRSDFSSLVHQILLVKTDWDNNLFCEANDFNTGCNWRSADDRPNMPTHGRWFQIPMSWRLADWVTLSYLDSHQDSCYPYCEQFKPKSVLLHDQDGVVSLGASGISMGLVLTGLVFLC